MRLCRSGKLHAIFPEATWRGTREVAKDQLEIDVRSPNCGIASNFLNAKCAPAVSRLEHTRDDGNVFPTSEQ
jgi:hypothetical protein